MNKVTIIGAGLVGSLWAVLLKRRGFDVDVFEKRSDLRLDTKDSGRSINLIITSRGMHALEQAGLLDEALRLSVPVYGRMMHSKTGELAYQPYGMDNERNLSISRSSLNQFLITASEKAGVKFHFNHDLKNIDFSQKTIQFSNGQNVFYEKLFGTDGAGSKVRKQLVTQFPNHFKEQTEWLEADYKELFLPKPNSLDPKALHIWPRGNHMMMALGNLDGSFTITLYLPKTGPVSFEKIQSSTEIQQLFENQFPDAISLMPNYIQDYQSHAQGALGTIRCSQWTLDDSVCLMGDAAHAIVPFFGQGMNSGFEDCTNFLKIFDQNNSDWKKTFSEYNETQRPNANAIADMAIENWIEMSEKVADPKFLLRKKIESILEKQFPKLFKSRYGMVTYTLIPYSLVQKAGKLQEEFFQELTEGLNSAEDLSIAKAETLLKKNYVPFLQQHNIKWS